ncbi:hypothetical protein VTP01DRAFT_401 [Rhizomucor pusillus]|uniref:uncharacterized protein n=1 Tax=Rhizomucor pusillus TaxID=4840 RepID=UPI00374408B8
MTTKEESNSPTLGTNEELASYIESVIEKLGKLNSANTHINDKLEEMGNRIDGLERSLSKIVKQLEAKQSAQEPEATESSE